jgi:hypothetical protein
MAPLKTYSWWSNFWANISSPSGAEILTKGVFQTCRAHKLGLTVVFSIGDSLGKGEDIPAQPGIDFMTLSAQLTPHSGKSMSFISDLDVTI